MTYPTCHEYRQHRMRLTGGAKHMVTADGRRIGSCGRNNRFDRATRRGRRPSNLVDDGRHISTAVHDFEMSADAAASTSPSSEEDCSTALADFIDFMDVLLEEPVENVGLEKQPSGTLKEVHEG